MKTSTIIVTIAAIILIAAGAWFVIMRQKQTPPPVPVDTTPVKTTETYASTTLGVSLEYPKEFTTNEVYAYNHFGPKKLIRGVSFVIPFTMATGTNLSPETYVSVEQLPNAKNCTGDIFIVPNVKPQTVTENGVEYSVATTSDPGAGNLYEETVYAIVGSKPCTAVRYFVHSMQIANYEPGTVTEFDRAGLLSKFDALRRSLMLASSAPATSSTTPAI